MVRVGGGWETLNEFLVKNDPCRGKDTIVVLQRRSSPGWRVVGSVGVAAGAGARSGQVSVSDNFLA